jgi:hypothetical protein
LLRCLIGCTAWKIDVASTSRKIDVTLIGWNFVRALIGFLDRPGWYFRIVSHDFSPGF